MEDVELLTLAQASRALGISQATAYRLIKNRTFPVPALRIGGTWKVSAAKVRELVESDSTGDTNGHGS